MGAYAFFLGFLFLYLTGVRSEQDTKTHLIISNRIYASGNNLNLLCQDACDESGDIIECVLKTSGKCISRYYLVCLKSQYGECHTINSSCSDESNLGENKCEEALQAKEQIGQNAQYVYRRLMRSNAPGVRQKLNTLNRRDLGTSDDIIPLFSPKSAMVATSGNGHAFVLDGDKIAESHFGGPPIISALNPGAKPEDAMNFPFSWVTSMAQKIRSNSDLANGQTPPKEHSLYGPSQYSPYRPQGTFSSWFGSDYGMYKYPTYYGNGGGTYSRAKSYSPFSAFFDSIGLQDPMLMLQYLPIAILTTTRTISKFCTSRRMATPETTPYPKGCLCYNKMQRFIFII